MTGRERTRNYKSYLAKDSFGAQIFLSEIIFISQGIGSVEL